MNYLSGFLPINSPIINEKTLSKSFANSSGKCRICCSGISLIVHEQRRGWGGDEEYKGSKINKDRVRVREEQRKEYLYIRNINIYKHVGVCDLLNLIKDYIDILCIWAKQTARREKQNCSNVGINVKERSNFSNFFPLLSAWSCPFH